MSIKLGHQEEPRLRIPKKTCRVGIVLCSQMSLGSLGLLMDLFRMGNQMPGLHRFELNRVSQDGTPVVHEDGELRVDGDMGLLSDMDLVIVPSMWTQGSEAVARHPGLVQALRDLPQRVFVVTVCTGAYLLAASGRLDGLRATTHWLLAGGLQAAYPAVRVDARENLIEQGRLVCSGGAMAGVDAGLRAV